MAASAAPISASAAPVAAEIGRHDACARSPSSAASPSSTSRARAGERHAGALGMQGTGDRRADAARGAGDQRGGPARSNMAGISRSSTARLPQRSPQASDAAMRGRLGQHALGSGRSAPCRRRARRSSRTPRPPWRRCTRASAPRAVTWPTSSSRISAGSRHRCRPRHWRSAAPSARCSAAALSASAMIRPPAASARNGRVRRPAAAPPACAPRALASATARSTAVDGAGDHHLARRHCRWPPRTPGLAAASARQWRLAASQVERRAAPPWRPVAGRDRLLHGLAAQLQQPGGVGEGEAAGGGQGANIRPASGRRRSAAVRATPMPTSAPAPRSTASDTAISAGWAFSVRTRSLAGPFEHELGELLARAPRRSRRKPSGQR